MEETNRYYLISFLSWVVFHNYAPPHPPIESQLGFVPGLRMSGSPLMALDPLLCERFVNVQTAYWTGLVLPGLSVHKDEKQTFHLPSREDLELTSRSQGQLNFQFLMNKLISK